MTATVTPTATVFPSALQMLVAANIRSGPGMDFPVVGYFSADAHPVVIGVSPDRGWWRVACPAGVEVDACWVVNDATVSIALSPVPASTQISQTPAPTVPPDPTPCTPVPGAGWGTYVVQDGDTLSTLASNTGVTVAELQAANCVEGELIVAGSPLYVPVRAETMNVSQPVASVAGGVATSAPDGETGRSALTQRIHFVAPGGGIAAGLDSAGSGSGSCPASVDEEVASVLIPKRQDNTIVDWREWESGEAIYLCFYGFPEDEEIVLTILDGGRTVIEQKIPVTTSTNRSYRWLLTTDFPHQEAPYSIQATAPGATVSGELRVLPATGQHILVLNNTVQVGDPLHINVMDKKISTTVYLYRNYGSDQTKCGQKYCYVGTIGPFPVQPNRGADLWIDTSELEAGIYVVAAGIDEAINLRNAGLFRLQ